MTKRIESPEHLDVYITNIISSITVKIDNLKNSKKHYSISQLKELNEELHSVYGSLCSLRLEV